MDERELVAKIISGDEDAFESFYDAHKKRLERTAAHFLGYGHPSIPDVVQDTFLASLPKLKEFRFESSLYTWLNRFTVNFCFQALKKGKKSIPTETEELEVLGKRRTGGLPQEIAQILNNEILLLSPEHRDVIIRKDIEGRSYLEIASELRLAPGTVMSRLSRARLELKKRLAGKKAVLESLWSNP